jgi:hypothetical protein
MADDPREAKPSPKDEPDDAWTLFEPFFEGWLPSSALTELEALLVADEKVLAAPGTFQKRFASLIEGAADEDDKPSDDPKVVAAKRGLSMMRAHQDRVDREFLASSIGQEFERFLGSVRDSIGVEALRSVYRPIQAFGLDDLIEPGNRVAPDAGDEEKVAAILRQVRRAAERLYKPLLQATLRLWRLITNAPEGHIPNELGKLMGDCELAWTGGRAGPTCVLDPFVRQARNSDGHSATDFDPTRRVVILVNTNREGIKTLIEIPAKELSERARGFLALCMTMWSAYRAVSGLPFADLPLGFLPSTPPTQPPLDHEP